MIAKAAPRYHFDRDARYVVTVRDDSGGRREYGLDGYQGWLAGPDGIRHRFGTVRRARTELPDDRITAVVGPMPAVSARVGPAGPARPSPSAGN